jgi:hypothetical protein
MLATIPRSHARGVRCPLPSDSPRCSALLRARLLALHAYSLVTPSLPPSFYEFISQTKSDRSKEHASPPRCKESSPHGRMDGATNLRYFFAAPAGRCSLDDPTIPRTRGPLPAARCPLTLRAARRCSAPGCSLHHAYSLVTPSLPPSLPPSLLPRLRHRCDARHLGLSSGHLRVIFGLGFGVQGLVGARSHG